MRKMQTKKALGVLGALLVIAPAFAGAAPSEPNTVTCTLSRAGTEFAGTCSIPCLVHGHGIGFDGPHAGASCAEPPRPVAATLRRIPASKNWLGTMAGRYPEDPTRFEVVTSRAGAPGLVKTPYGWFRLETSRVTDDKIDLTVLANAEVPPTRGDVRIIQRATTLLSDAKVWNKKDDRNCPANPKQWSVYCALMQATEEVSGGVHYRQPALQVVREVVNEIGGTRVKTHRLMDYNNHPDTTLDDIQSMLRLAQARLEQRLR